MQGSKGKDADGKDRKIDRISQVILRATDQKKL